MRNETDFTAASGKQVRLLEGHGVPRITEILKNFSICFLLNVFLRTWNFKKPPQNLLLFFRLELTESRSSENVCKQLKVTQVSFK